MEFIAILVVGVVLAVVGWRLPTSAPAMVLATIVPGICAGVGAMWALVPPHQATWQEVIVPTVIGVAVVVGLQLAYVKRKYHRSLRKGGD